MKLVWQLRRVFDVPENASVVLGTENPNNIEGAENAFGVHNLQWQANSAPMFVDMTDWTDEEGHSMVPNQDLGV